MSVTIQQDGLPRLPEPGERQYPGITEDQELREYLRVLVRALQDYLQIVKIDVDALAAPVNSGLAGTKTYYVSDTNGGAVNRKLTFVDGILTAET